MADARELGAPAPRRSRRRRSDDSQGTLVLIGGACDPRGPALGAFVELARARDGGRIVGLTTASVNPARAAVHWLDDFASIGVHDVEIPIVDLRHRAQDPRIAERVAGADGIFLGGGDQVQLLSVIGGSRVARAIRDAFARGAVVCGTSAGAASLSETVLAGGEVDATGAAAELHLGPGLGLLRYSSLVDTHFTQRGRLQRLFRRVAENPELLGLGIDEDTALIVRGHLAEVAGGGNVTYVDGRSVRFDNAKDALEHGAPLTLSYLRVGLIGAGHVFNLRERELEVLVQAESEQEETPTVQPPRA